MKINRLLYVIMLGMLVWLIALTANTVSNQTKEITVVNEEVTGFSTDLTKVAEQQESMVAVLKSDMHISTAFFYKKVEDNSYFISTMHGASFNNLTLQLANGYEASAETVACDPFADVCLLKTTIPYDIHECTFGNASLLKKGEFLMAFGTPYSSEHASTVALAMVSDDLRFILNDIEVADEQYTYYQPFLQINALLPVGYSGGPLFNMGGDLVGMISLSPYTEENVVYALTGNELKIAADALLNQGEGHRTLFGFKGSCVNSLKDYERAALAIPLDQTDGFYISEIKPESLAANAGLLEKDILVSINERVIKSLDDYLGLSYQTLTEIHFKVLRNGQTLDLTVNIEPETIEVEP